MYFILIKNCYHQQNFLRERAILFAVSNGRAYYKSQYGLFGIIVLTQVLIFTGLCTDFYTSFQKKGLFCKTDWKAVRSLYVKGKKFLAISLVKMRTFPMEFKEIRKSFDRKKSRGKIRWNIQFPRRFELNLKVPLTK